MPVAEVTEEDLNNVVAEAVEEESDNSNVEAIQEVAPAQVPMMTAAAAANAPIGTKSLNFTAAQINDKLSHVNAYAMTSHTYNSYVPAITVQVAATGDSRFEGNYLITPYSDFVYGPGDTASSIINFKIWVKDGVIKTLKVTCLAGKIDPSIFDVQAGDFKVDAILFRLFIKSNVFRGSLIIRELSMDVDNVRVTYIINDKEYPNIVPQWNLFPANYDNVASEVEGFTKPWIMNIRRLPTSNEDLFTSLFEPNIGFDDVAIFFELMTYGIPFPIFLSFTPDYYVMTSIPVSAEIKYREDEQEIDFDLSFIHKMQAYRIKFTIWDDGQPAPGSGEVTIKSL